MTSCLDCPDLQFDAETLANPNWKPRARCCRDEHIDRRLAGDFDPWIDVATARAIADKPAEPMSRQQRRHAKRKGRI